MTQDQYGQDEGPGYVGGDVMPDETEEQSTEPNRPMTRFQKVASALRGDRPDRDEMDAGQEVPPGDPAAESGTGPRDYWDDAADADRDHVTAVSSPDGPGVEDHAPTEPDMFGATGRAGSGNGSVPDMGAEGRGADATIPDVPPAGTGVAETDPAGTGVAGTGVAGTGVAGTDPAGTGVAGTGGSMGRHAADPIPDDEAMVDTAPASTSASAGQEPAFAPASSSASAAEAAAAADPAGTGPVDEVAEPAGAPAGTGPAEMRPGEAAGTLGDFSDLTYGNLIPDAETYTNQWQQVQFRFVDDPHGSVTEAADIISQVTAKLEAAIQERQRAIEERQRAIAEQQRSLRDRWGEGSSADTETLRETLRMYRTFLDQLIGSRAS